MSNYRSIKLLRSSLLHLTEEEVVDLLCSVNRSRKFSYLEREIHSFTTVTFKEVIIVSSIRNAEALFVSCDLKKSVSSVLLLWS